MLNNIMGNHDKYVGKCTVFVGTCCEMICSTIWFLKYFKWRNACSRKRWFGFGFIGIHAFTNNVIILRKLIDKIL